MNIATEQKIELVLKGLRDKATRQFEGTIRKLSGSQYGSPPTISSATITDAMRAVKDNSLALLQNGAIEVSSVSKTMDAFGLLKRAMVNHLSDLTRLVEQWRGASLNSQQLELVRELYSVSRDDLLLNVDEYQNRFKNQGGRPEVWPWDEAKAYVKSAYSKGFKPYHGLNTQVAEALRDWFEQRYDDSPGKTQLYDHAKDLVEKHMR
jgi:hypothetical protein